MIDALPREPSSPAARLLSTLSSGFRDALVGSIRVYRLLLSPWLGNACRFEPTCSRYAIDAIESHGSGVGSYLALRRIARCHPWCPGGVDPVPTDAPPLFTGMRRTDLRNSAGLRVAASPPISTDKNTP